MNNFNPFYTDFCPICHRSLKENKQWFDCDLNGSIYEKNHYFSGTVQIKSRIVLGEFDLWYENNKTELFSNLRIANYSPIYKFPFYFPIDFNNLPASEQRIKNIINFL